MSVNITNVKTSIKLLEFNGYFKYLSRLIQM